MSEVAYYQYFDFLYFYIRVGSLQSEHLIFSRQKAFKDPHIAIV